MCLNKKLIVYELTERGLTWKVVADTASKVIFFAVNNYSGVPDAVNLLTNHLTGELSCHAVGEIIDVQLNEEGHYLVK